MPMMTRVTHWKRTSKVAGGPVCDGEESDSDMLAKLAISRKMLAPWAGTRATKNEIAAYLERDLPHSSFA